MKGQHLINSLPESGVVGTKVMSDVGGKVPGGSVVGPASRPALDVNTAVNQGADKSTSSSQAADDMAAPNQPTDTITAVNLGTESSENVHPDFSILPSLIWLGIFSMLTQRDRRALSVTCRKLHGVSMECSVLWRSAFINLGDTNPHKELKLSTADKSVLRKHGHQMRNISIHQGCVWPRMLDSSSMRLLCQAARRWPLKQLEVRTDYSGQGYHYIVTPPVQRLLHTCLTSPSASQLSSLSIVINDWPASGDNTSGVVEALKHSSFTSSLTHLSLDLIMPSPRYLGEFGKVIERFQNLYILMMPYHYLSDNVLSVIPKQLKEIHFAASTLDETKEVTNWPQVLAASPQLTVGLCFDGMPPFRVLHHMFPSVVSVSTVTVKGDKAGEKFQWPLLGLLAGSFVHMESLQCRFHESDSSLEDQLIIIANKCHGLDHLDYSGTISSDSVLTLAVMRKWRKLVFYEEFIVFRGSSEREKQLQALCEKVSWVLGRDWKPWPRSKTLNSAPTNDCTRPFSVTVHPDLV